MRHSSPLVALLLLANSLVPASHFAARVQDRTEPPLEPVSGSVVCEPGLYPSPPDGCLPVGPSEYLARLAGEGIPYPLVPLPAFSPDYDLNTIPFRYFKVEDTGTPLYVSLDDAINDNSSGQALAPGLLYVSYTDMLQTDIGVVFQLTTGSWIRGVGSRISVPVFQGLQFSSTPPNSFGWVLGEAKSRTAPGFRSPATGHIWQRYDVAQVYAIQQADNISWLLVGPDEWLDYRQVSRVDPRSAPPPGVSGARWIDVNLDEQTLAVYQDGQLVFATLIASGIEPFWTRPGLFQIYKKKDTEHMSGATAADRSDYYYLQDVPWTMYFDDQRALHGAYWHNMFGYPRSHGCVNLSVGDSHWLYDWAVVGDYVYIYDPSGHTPTDASLYGAGAP